MSAGLARIAGAMLWAAVGPPPGPIAQRGTGASSALGTPFRPGEVLAYDLTVFGAEAGRAQIVLGSAVAVDGISAWPIVVRTQSAGAIDRFFPVRDRFVSWWDPATRLAVESRLDASEGGKVHRLRIRFRRPAGAAATADVELTDRHGTASETDAVDPRAEDLAAAVFWLRCQSLRPGERYVVPIFTGKKQWPLGAAVVAAETVATPIGSVPCVHVRLSTTFAGKLASRGDLDAWFSADARHLPVRLDADLLIGRMRAELSKVED